MRIFASVVATALATLILGSAQPAYAQENNNDKDKQNKIEFVEEVKVERGDTLTKIADKHETTYVRLFNANQSIEHPDVIYPGDKVGIPDEEAKLKKRELPNATTQPTPAPQPEPQPAPVAQSQPQPSPAPTPAPQPHPQAVSGSSKDWLNQSNIAARDHGYASTIISRESGWNHAIWNTTGSGAYGLCQALPASKMASAGGDYMTNPVTQLNWCNSYAQARYGGWAQAHSFWQANHWW